MLRLCVVIASIIGLTTVLPGCALFGEEPTDSSVVVARADDGEPITWDELDALTRAFADRQVGLVYTVTQELAADGTTADERRASRTLLADVATNIYNIASAENVFNRVLDFAVITALLDRQWGDRGRAREVFGEKGERLSGALSDMAADARSLAGRVLQDEQLRTLDALVESWHERNPQVEEVSFIRFAQFATGESRPDAESLLNLGAALFAEIGEAGEAVDDAARVADRALYRAERAATLMRWQVAAVKADALATPEVGDALDQISTISGQLDTLPGALGDEAESVLTALDERLPALNEAMSNARGVINEADALADSVEAAGASVESAVQASSSLMDSAGGEEGSPDIAQYEQTAESVGDAALRVENAAATIGELLGTPGETGGPLGAATDAADELIGAVFWRLVALMGIFFVLLLIYRVVSIRLARPRDRQVRGRAVHAEY